LLKLKDKLYKINPYYIIKPDYNLIKLNAKEVKEFGYKKARILRSLTFCNKVKRIIYKAFFKGAAFYYNLLVSSNKEINVNNNKKDINIFESYKEEIIKESTNKY
jgi:hypothetical protein